MPGHIQAIQLQPEEFERRIVDFFDKYLRWVYNK